MAQSHSCKWTKVRDFFRIIDYVSNVAMKRSKNRIYTLLGQCRFKIMHNVSDDNISFVAITYYLL